jgi:hypothetical protein
MKFRIVHNGLIYKVQARVLWQWQDLAEDLLPIEGRWTNLATYDRFADAFQDIKKKHGEHAVVVRPWQVVTN